MWRWRRRRGRKKKWMKRIRRQDIWERCDLLWHPSRLRAWCYWPRCTVHCLSQSSGRSLGPGPWSPGVVPVLRRVHWNPGWCRWAFRSGTWPHNHLLPSDCGWTPGRKMTPCLTPGVLLGLTEYHILEDTNQKRSSEKNVNSQNSSFRLAVSVWDGKIGAVNFTWKFEVKAHVTHNITMFHFHHIAL